MMIAAFALALITNSAHASTPVRTEAVYDGDHRVDIGDVADPSIQKLADSTVAMFMIKDLVRTPNGFTFNQNPAMNICPSEKFSNQSTAAECSGVLISPSRILTAGHCVDKDSCGESAFVFGYRLGTSEFASFEVYACKKLVSWANTDTLDYAVVELDREVRTHEPVAIASDKPQVGDKVFLLSHPAGTPLKYSRPAVVKSSKRKTFTAELDALGGSSGGAVFSEQTNELVGILVSGEEDYVNKPGEQCRSLNNCTSGSCDGEDSTPVTAIPGIN